ncbi:phosphate acyltransferase PlsX [Desulfoplanes formicivorans]|uniref:Phosphate acyltransferase n=1 Tax=Desulfoplanes formicivorans TaxID=1592317 RepID=A0A194AFN3_9BACT|nr:phosphate acyltransferase PlsX [Desulfoplanes formicivorans]GAU07896.1 phosphate acyltransferase [Desulfoplanes formicivorans]
MPNHPSGVCIAVDAMGGDFGPEVVVKGAIEASQATGISLLLVGREEEIHKELAKYKTDKLPIQVVNASQVVGMTDKPSDVLRRKKDSSIHVACRLVKEGQAHGVVSAGNSGAILACGMFVLGRIKGVERPALATILPTEKNPLVFLDVGGNMDCKPYHLVQFGVMAEVLAKDLLGIPNPKVGLLSIGEEEGKGNILAKEAYKLFKLSSMNFVGNAEGRDLFTGNFDVIVCDGFVGNAVLKVSEGVAKSISSILKAEIRKSLLFRFGCLLALPVFRRLAKRLDYAEYGGAHLLGLNGTAIVCHGASNVRAIRIAIEKAAEFVASQANEHLVKGLKANKELAQFGKRAKA